MYGPMKSWLRSSISRQLEWRVSSSCFSARRFGTSPTTTTPKPPPPLESQQQPTLTVDTNNPTTTKKKTKDDRDVPLEAHFKNPIVAKLWAARQEAKTRLGLSDDSRGGGSNTTDVTKAAAQVMAAGKSMEDGVVPTRGKTPSESRTEISYLFSKDEILKEAYQNPWGEMRFGKVRNQILLDGRRGDECNLLSLSFSHYITIHHYVFLIPPRMCRSLKI